MRRVLGRCPVVIGRLLGQQPARCSPIRPYWYGIRRKPGGSARDWLSQIRPAQAGSPLACKLCPIANRQLGVKPQTLLLAYFLLPLPPAVEHPATPGTVSPPPRSPAARS